MDKLTLKDTTKHTSCQVSDTLLETLTSKKGVKKVSLGTSLATTVKKVSKEALAHYKELHAKGYNYAQKVAKNGSKTAQKSSLSYEFLCGSKVCNYAKCQKEIRFECQAYNYALAGLERLTSLGLLTQKELHKEVQTASPQSSKTEYREFMRSLNAKGSYKGLGNEAQSCGMWGMLKRCEHGHKIVKRLVDGREWCPRCGQRGSEAHNRRIARLIDRVYSMESVGYLVLELPVAVRKWAIDVEFLREFRRYVLRMLDRELGCKGIARWHYCGDDGKTWKPHLNLLIEHGYIGKKQLKRLRVLCSKWLQQRLDKRHYRVAPLWYRFTKKEGKIWHWLSYITRATLTTLTDDNRHIASELYAFNNITWFGKFSDDDKTSGRARFEAYIATLTLKERQSIIDVEAHDRWFSGLCPVCGGRTELVEGVVKVDKLKVLTDYGGGLLYVKEDYDELEYNTATPEALSPYASVAWISTKELTMKAWAWLDSRKHSGGIGWQV